MLHQASDTAEESHLVRFPRHRISVSERSTGHRRREELQFDAAPRTLWRRLPATFVPHTLLPEVADIDLLLVRLDIVGNMHIPSQLLLGLSVLGLLEVATIPVRPWVDQVGKENLHPSCERLVSREAGSCVDHTKRSPKIEIRLTVRSHDKLVEGREQTGQPPIKVVLPERRCLRTDLLPICRSASQSDRREPATATHGVCE